jgi:hypothetical protein
LPIFHQRSAASSRQSKIGNRKWLEGYSVNG